MPILFNYEKIRIIYKFALDLKSNPAKNVDRNEILFFQKYVHTLQHTSGQRPIVFFLFWFRLDELVELGEFN